MRILELELQHFRNYSGQRVSFDPDCNVIFGENAQGKTNLLEAIVYLSCGKSPRARTDREMIAFDAPAAVLEAGISARDREFRTRVELYRDRRRKMWVNQVPAKNSAALSQVYHTVFSVSYTHLTRPASVVLVAAFLAFRALASCAACRFSFRLFFCAAC